MTEIGATISKKGASSAQIESLQQAAKSLGREVGTNDASIIGGALNNNASVLTIDKTMTKFMKAIGLPVKSF